MTKFEMALKTLCEETKGFWNEASDLVATLWSNWDQLREAKIKDCKARFEEIYEWLRSGQKGVEVLPFDEKILAAVKGRVFGGGHPRQPKGTNSRRLEADLSIIESLMAFFRLHRNHENRLLLCTENLKDFAVTIDGQNYLHTFSLRPPAHHGFHRSNLSTRLYKGQHSNSRTDCRAA